MKILLRNNGGGTTVFNVNRMRCAMVFVLFSFTMNTESFETQSCNNDRGMTIEHDHALVGHVIETLKTEGLIECLTNCMGRAKCLSVNYAEAGDPSVLSQCELNYMKANQKTDLVFRLGNRYFELIGKKAFCINGNFVNGKCECTAPYSGIYCDEFRPTNCKDIQEHGTTEDGEYDLYFMWPADSKTARIYCANMNAQTPLEYVTLTSGKANNFARHYNKNTHVLEETYFEKIRLRLEGMQVLIGDYRFATTNGAGVFHRYGSAADCKSSSCHSSRRSGFFKVDVSGTSFRLPATIPYSFHSYPGCVKKHFSPSMDAHRLRWSAKCGGYCGLCVPNNLYLEFNG